MAADVPHADTVTLEHVAAAAGVSRQTVSNAINAPERVSAPTLVRVLEVVDRLAYRPNRHARSLRTRRSHLIGLRVEQSGGPDRVLDRLLHALSGAAELRGDHILVFGGRDPGDELSGYESLLRSTAVDAFVLTATHRGDRRLAGLRSRGAPFVAFGRPWGEPDAAHPWVDVDGAAGTAAATAHLLERGHASVAFLGWPEGSDVGADREAGWRRTLAAAAVPAPPVLRSLDDVDAAREAVLHALGGDAPPTALVCASDTLAIGAYHALAARGLHPGRDVAVVGFDDSVPAALLLPPMSSVAQPVEEVARTLVRQLAALREGRADGSAGVLLEPSLVVRSSSSRAVIRPAVP